MRSRCPRDRGSVTAEFAVAVVAACIVLGFLLGGLRIGATQVTCTDTAGTAARLAGRGEPRAVVAGAVEQGCGRLVSIADQDAFVCVVVAGDVGLVGAAVTVPVDERACALRSTP